MKFNKNTIMHDIAKRMGDNELKLYKYRGWSAFVNTMTNLAADRTAWERQEISPLLKHDKINLEFENATFAYLLPQQAIAFTDVWIDPAVNNAWGGILKRIDEMDAQRASTGEIAFMQAGNEIFWYNVGDEFRFILSKDIYIKPNAATSAVAVTGTVMLEYVSDPNFIDLEEINEENELIDLVKDLRFSSRFLYRCINDAIIMLRMDNEVVRPEEQAIDIEDTTGTGAV